MNLKLKFFGAAKNVTGSRYLLETNDSRVLVDCGMYQERDFRVRNWDPFPVAPNSIDAVLLTHAHLDHCGYLPKLVKDGFSGRVFCTSATAEIAKIIMLDSAHIQVEDAQFKKRRHQREGKKAAHPEMPLYTSEDAEAAALLLTNTDYETPQQITNDISATFFDAGHILGSSMIKVKVNQNGEERSIIFSGDIGRWETPILVDPTNFDEADYILMESTYGDRYHGDRDGINDLLADTINKTKENGGNILIPSFAVERSQEILYYLNKLLIEDRIPHLMVILDSPMAINVTKVFMNHSELFDEEMLALIKRHDSPFDFQGLKMTRTVRESKAVNHIKGTVLVIAGSGMCTAGRIKHHLVTNISRPESTILFVGYQAKGTLGRQIVEGNEEVRILGQFHKVQASVVQINGFSAHADKTELMRWLSSIKKPPRQLFVTHGEDDVALSFGEFLRQEKNWNIAVPSYLDEYILE